MPHHDHHYDVKISYDPNSDPAWNTPNITAKKGFDLLHFHRQPGSADWDFQAVVIWPSGTTQPTTNPDDPQSNVCSPFTVVETDDDHMKVNDDNQNQPGTFNYQIWIKTSDGSYVGSDPVILNKGGD